MTNDPPRHVAVIDIGKTNAKVAIIDMATLAEIAVRTRSNTVLSGPPYPHYDIEGLWTFILDALGALQREHAIDAIITATHGAAGVLLRADGELALPALDYEHDGPEILSADYDAVRPPFAETGSPRLPGGLNLGAQFFWQARRFPGEFAQAAHIVMYPQYWGFRLTGIAANEVTSLGAHTDLWNPTARDYSALVDRAGWRSLLAPIRPAGGSLGPISPEIAARTGLRQGTPVHCGIHDSNAALLPHLMARQPPFSVVSTGTWVIIMSIGGGQVALDSERDTLMNVNAFGDPVASARFMGGREHAMLTDGLEEGCTEADVDAVLARGLFLLPSVQPGCGPFPRRKSEWIGEGAMSPGARRAAVSFYLALMTATCLELIAADGPIIAEGPFARNDLYLRMLAAATGRKVIASVEGGAGMRAGAALLTSPTASPPAHSDIPVEVPGQLWADYARHWNALLRGHVS